jgi:trans-aconitate methyltransferase
MDLKDTYDKIADDWLKDHQSDDWWVEGTDTFISLLEPNALVLDVGCGAGVKSRYLIEQGLRVVGIDFSERFIEIATEEVPEGKFLVMDMRDLSSLSQTYAAVFAQASLLHIPKKEALATLSGLVEKLQPQGLLYVAVKGIREGAPDEEIKQEHDYGYPYERFFSYYSMDELRSYFEELGLRVVYENAHKTGKTDWLQIIGERTQTS